MTIEPDEIVHVAAGEVMLEGNCVVSADAPGIVAFVYGSGSSRHRPRNHFARYHFRNEACRRHYRHSSLLVSYYGRDVMIDAGEDWRGNVEEIGPDAIVLSHAHPDHAFGLRNGAPCTTFATGVTWNAIDENPRSRRTTIGHRDPFVVEAMRFEAFPVEHSTVAPAVGYRVTVFYVPDVVYIKDRTEGLQDVRFFIGDGATIKRPLVRRRHDVLIGHAAIQTQLTRCKKEGESRTAFPQCRSPIVAGDDRTVGPVIRRLGAERRV